MTGRYSYPHLATDAERDLQQDALQAREMLGLDISSAPVSERVLARTRNRIADEADPPVSHPSAEPPPVRAHRLRRAARWLAVAAVLAALAVVVPLGFSPSASAGPPHLSYELSAPEDSAAAPSAHEVLTGLAVAALRAPASGSGPVSYVESFGWTAPFSEGDSWTQPFREQVWVGEDGSALVMQDIGAAITREGRLDLSADQSFTGLSRDEIPPGTFGVPAVGDRPEALFAQWRAELQSEAFDDDDGRAYGLLNEVRALATFRVLEPQELSALWSMLAQEPGLRTLGRVTDRLGRDCIAITTPPFEWDGRTWVDVLLIDSATGHLVGTEEVTLSSDAQGVHSPTVTSYRVITTAELVPDVGTTRSRAAGGAT